MKHKPKLPRLNGACPNDMVRRVVGQVDQFRYLIRTKHYSLSTENTYVDWGLAGNCIGNIELPRNFKTSNLKMFI